MWKIRRSLIIIRGFLNIPYFVIFFKTLHFIPNLLLSNSVRLLMRQHDFTVAFPLLKLKVGEFLILSFSPNTFPEHRRGFFFLNASLLSLKFEFLFQLFFHIICSFGIDSWLQIKSCSMQLCSFIINFLTERVIYQDLSTFLTNGTSLHL